ncbi:MAG: DUF5597 domain-containing protein [Eubacteriales bacterium]|nr:DUF5597 domain-containing protein [Eubacteriales bacterium]
MSDFFINKQGEPVFLAGLQCHNSSSGTEMIDTTIEAVRLFGGNLIEAPVYWCEVEKEKDSYDFSMAAELVDKATEAGLYLIPLWFGFSKNGLFTYAPEYVKRDCAVYKRARNSAGIPVESLSPHCAETLAKDKKAFVKLMEFLAEYDKRGTVIAVQVENEVGLVHTDRDYCQEADREFYEPVPEYLRGAYVPDCGTSSSHSSQETSGSLSWTELFGRHGAEAFTAWKFAQYIQAITQAAKEKFDIPYIMNVSIEVNEYEAPGYCYVSGGPVARVLDIWKKTAADIHLFGPDIYLAAERDYRKACKLYGREDNPLFIPESLNSGMGAALNMFLAAGDYSAVGICCFGAESIISNGVLLPEAEYTARSMRAIAAMEPLLIKYYKTGRVYSVTQAEFAQWQYVKTDEYHIVAKFLSNDPKPQNYFGSRINTNALEQEFCMTERGRCLIVDCGGGEFYISGLGVCLSFLKRPDVEDKTPYAHLGSALSGQLNFLSIEEGHFEGSQWVCEYMRNGDEANYQLYVHPGQVIRVRLNPEIRWEE